MDMPKIDGCNVTQCAYNHDGQCHALAITVGDAAGPRCDTYLDSGGKGGDPQSSGRVGACKMATCVHNRMLECSAQAIRVASRAGEADCLTFEQE